MNRPQISVLIPTYNYARYLPEAVESVLAQDFQDYEILIADDGSTDGSGEVIARYAARDPRVRAQVHAENVGMVQNWNWCLSQARGEYIKFLFGDDKLASPKALGTLLGLLLANPTATLAASARLVIDENSEIVRVTDELPAGLQAGQDIIARSILEYGNVVGEPSVVMFRKRDFERGFDTGYRQFVDVEMLLYMLEKGDLVYTPEPIVCFRKHVLQQTQVIRSAGSLGREEAARLFWDYYKRPYILEKPGHRRLLYKQLRELKKTCVACPELMPLADEMADRLGPVWRFLLWLQYSFSRPVANLRRSVQRRYRKAVYERQAAARRC